MDQCGKVSPNKQGASSRPNIGEKTTIVLPWTLPPYSEVLYRVHSWTPLSHGSDSPASISDSTSHMTSILDRFIFSQLPFNHWITTPRHWDSAESSAVVFLSSRRKCTTPTPTHTHLKILKTAVHITLFIHFFCYY